jgi:hypothetical protein
MDFRTVSPRKSRETESELRATGSKSKFEESKYNFEPLINNIQISKRKKLADQKTRNITEKARNC